MQKWVRQAGVLYGRQNQAAIERPESYLMWLLKVIDMNFCGQLRTM